ncbi:zinc finger, CCHC-type containing protein [Tanacetum coccineum]
MGYIYDAMSRAKDQISKNLKGGSNERLVSRVWSMIQTRWTDQFHHPLHAVGCFLNPAIFHGENSKVVTNKEILTDLYVVIDRLVPDPDENDSVREELNIASPCERNWSAFDNLHSKKRNCLLQQKLNDLVFIQYNTRLRRRFESIKTNKSLDPILLRVVEEDTDEWTIPTENELQDFVNAGDGLLWSDRYRDDDDEISVGGGLEEEVNALDDVDSDAEPLDCN